MHIPDIRKRPWKNIDLMVIGLLDTLDGMTKVISLGFSSGKYNICMKYLEWRTRMMFNRLKK
jgi:hypothetical protein